MWLGAIKNSLEALTVNIQLYTEEDINDAEFNSALIHSDKAAVYLSKFVDYLLLPQNVDNSIEADIAKFVQYTDGLRWPFGELLAHLKMLDKYYQQAVALSESRAQSPIKNFYDRTISPLFWREKTPTAFSSASPVLTKITDSKKHSLLLLSAWLSVFRTLCDDPEILALVDTHRHCLKLLAPFGVDPQFLDFKAYHKKLHDRFKTLQSQTSTGSSPVPTTSRFRPI